MHSDQSVRHIALTCPHCGKHYKKVPYDAICKHRFAFCKQCNTKFPVDPAMLEEALKQATLVDQSLEVAASINQHTEDATEQEREHESALERAAQIENMQIIPGLNNIVQQAAKAAEGFPPEPPASAEPHEDGMASQLFASPTIETKEQPDIQGSFEQKINTLAAKIEETFGRRQEASTAVDTGGTAFETVFGDIFIDKTQAGHMLETQRDYPAGAAPAAVQEQQGMPFEESINYQPNEAAIEKDSEQEFSEASTIRNQAADASPAAAPGQEIYEEPLLENQLITASTENDSGEAPIDECLIEDHSPEQPGQDIENAIGDQDNNPPVFTQSRELNDGLAASPDDAGAHREVSAMLKDIVLPPAGIEEGTEQFVLFSLNDQMFAAPIANVFELSLQPDIIMVPSTPPWMLGVANMRGEIISIVDLMGFLNISQENQKKQSRMIIAQTKDRQMMLGLIVDRINGIKYFATDEIFPLEQKTPGQSAAYLNGALTHEDTAVPIFDLEKLLQSSKMRQFQ